MCKSGGSTITLVLSLMLILASAAPALGQQSVSVPVGTVIHLRIDKPLSSNSSRVGDAFTSTVFRPVLIDGRPVLPEGAKVEGRVTGIGQGVRGKSPATIAVAFDKISLPDGKSIPIETTLTTLDEEARRRIEQEVRSQTSAGRTRPAVVFLGARGTSATIGVTSGGGDTTSVGQIIGSVLGGGDRADVQSGAEFGMMVQRSFNVDTTTIAADRDSAAQSQSVLSSYDSIRAAQIALRDRNYYNGQINGAMNQATREAIRNFQQDRNLAVTGELNLSTARTLGIPIDVGGRPSQPFTSVEAIRFAQMNLRDRGHYTGPINGTMTQATRGAIREFQRERNLTLSGELDSRTARELGIASDAGIESAALELLNARAERIGAGSIRISGDVHTQGSGWQFFVNRFVNGNTLHVYVRGVPPRSQTGSATEQRPFTETYNDLQAVARVVFHGPQRDFTAELRDSGGGAGTGSIGDPRQIAFLADRLLQDFQRELNIRRDRGQVIFDTRRNFKPNEVELLSQMTSLRASADLYSQLTASINDRDSVKAAAVGLMRQARLLERIIRRSQTPLSSLVTSDLQQLQSELARISIIDPNLDSDIVR